jgi:hypothetical protein
MWPFPRNFKTALVLAVVVLIPVQPILAGSCCCVIELGCNEIQGIEPICSCPREHGTETECEFGTGCSCGDVENGLTISVDARRRLIRTAPTSPFSDAGTSISCTVSGFRLPRDSAGELFVLASADHCIRLCRLLF